MDNEVKWNAVKNCDENFDEAFYYGVETTGIFCKPSCRSKLPKRENVAFFESASAAQDAGFRPCKRCRPETNSPDPASEMIVRACEILDKNESISISELAGELDVSPGYLQKSFKSAIGVSPKKYQTNQRMKHFKTALKQGQSVAGSMYDTGFGSSSRLYENVSGKLGMTPKVYKDGGKDMKILYAVRKTYLGELLVARTDAGICSVTIGDSAGELAEDLRSEFPAAEISEVDSDLNFYLDEVIKNLDGSLKRLDLPLDLRATAFQMRVWEELQKIPYGQTVSYADIAEKIGNKKAVRAVARACASNRVAVVIPCHRVIKNDGSLSGYRWGTQRKKAILETEKRNAERSDPEDSF